MAVSRLCFRVVVASPSPASLHLQHLAELRLLHPTFCPVRARGRAEAASLQSRGHHNALVLLSRFLSLPSRSRRGHHPARSIYFEWPLWSRWPGLHLFPPQVTGMGSAADEEEARRRKQRWSRAEEAEDKGYEDEGQDDHCWSRSVCHGLPRPHTGHLFVRGWDEPAERATSLDANKLPSVFILVSPSSHPLPIFLLSLGFRFY